MLGRHNHIETGPFTSEARPQADTKILNNNFTLNLGELKIGRGESAPFNLQRLIESGSSQVGDITITLSPDKTFIITQGNKQVADVKTATFLSQLSLQQDSGRKKIGLDVANFQDAFDVAYDKNLDDRVDFFDDDKKAA